MRFCLLGVLMAAACLGQEGSNPWSRSELMEPSELAAAIQKPNRPMVISVAFPVLYRSRHILHAVDGGAASKPEGIETLKKLVSSSSKDADIVIYCGCCPMEKCPNVRPAYRLLKEMGFKRVRVLNIPTNMATDWNSKGYPSEPGTAGAR
jgi:rhodanese-related sulfurtransferase